MFRQVVVGVDGHEGGRDAIALAWRLLAPDGELTLAHVYTGEPDIYRSVSVLDGHAQRRQVLELLERTRRTARVPAHLRWCGFPPVGRRLHELCEELAADLLVVGSARRGRLGRVLLGDDTQAALSGAPCAIAIAPVGYSRKPGALRKVGVGYDGSPESEHALGLARQLAPGAGATLSACEVITLPSTALSTGPLPFEQMVNKVIAEARHRIAVLGGIEPHGAYGEASEALALYSDTVDLLIVGSRGYGPLGRLFHGSTSHVLARRAGCPLLVLPRAGRAAELNAPTAAGRGLLARPSAARSATGHGLTTASVGNAGEV